MMDYDDFQEIAFLDKSDKVETLLRDYSQLAKEAKDAGCDPTSLLGGPEAFFVTYRRTPDDPAIRNFYHRLLSSGQELRNAMDDLGYTYPFTSELLDKINHVLSIRPEYAFDVWEGELEREANESGDSEYQGDQPEQVPLIVCPTWDTAREVAEKIRKFASTKANVLILGEPGVGKTHLAR